MLTLLREGESVINGRPLTYVSDDPDETTAIIPANFIPDTRGTEVYDLDIIDAKYLLKRVRYLQNESDRLKSPEVPGPSPHPPNPVPEVSRSVKQTRCEVIIGIPSDAILIYTDGSQDESNSTESGPFIEKLSIRLSRHNPENCSVLRSELIVVDEGLKSILNKTDSSNIWILTDSRSAIQHLQDWTRADDLVSIRIINKLKTIAKYRDVHFMWIASHVNVPGNEIPDFLVKRGCSEIATTDIALTYREIYSLMKIKED
ncbi:RNase H domain-containing protein [Trichonephila clavipes]|uniref:RNase H domain-containing protein n=1 Tax=Trichonephila clavipes TaxID=2585209 RepID=A0A8X6VJH2_TRICX|nr:RNase H domain-containing protein [Trichonephila clavipes]